MLTIRQISRNCLYTVGMFLVSGALSLIGMGIIGFLICVFGGDR